MFSWQALAGRPAAWQALQDATLEEASNLDLDDLDLDLDDDSLLLSAEEDRELLSLVDAASPEEFSPPSSKALAGSALLPNSEEEATDILDPTADTVTEVLSVVAAVEPPAGVKAPGAQVCS